VCGRYYLLSAGDLLKKRFRLSGGLSPFAPRFNIAPSQDAPVIVDKGAGRVIVPMRWGLVPSWAADPSVGFKTINARAETAASKASFQEPMRSRRALVPADGFYEWKALAGSRTKQPHAIRLKSRAPFAFAGLWDRFTPGNGPPLSTFTILTTSANATVAPIHDRMPVILSPGAEEAWLDPRVEDVRALAPLLVPYDAAAMEAVPVSSAVSSTANDGPECLAPPAAEPLPDVARQRGFWDD
jgi:putative SOS response-associated peptidase YedK